MSVGFVFCVCGVGFCCFTPHKVIPRPPPTGALRRGARGEGSGRAPKVPEAAGLLRGAPGQPGSGGDPARGSAAWWAPWRWGGQLAGRSAALWGAGRAGTASGEAQPQREPRNPGGLCGAGSGAGSGAACPPERATARAGAQQKKQDKSYLGLLYFYFLKHALSG